MRILRIAAVGAAAVAAVAAAALAVVIPAGATSADQEPGFPAPAFPSKAGWFGVPTAPFDIAAGVLCAAPIHIDLPVDEVVERVLTRYSSGSPHLVQFTGPLTVRVTNTLTGASAQVDASGSANVEIHEDGALSWRVNGPAVFGFRDGHGNLPRGLYQLTGIYGIEQSAIGDRILTMVTGTQVNICTSIE